MINKEKIFQILSKEENSKEKRKNFERILRNNLPYKDKNERNEIFYEWRITKSHNLYKSHFKLFEFLRNTNKINMMLSPNYITTESRSYNAISENDKEIVNTFLSSELLDDKIPYISKDDAKDIFMIWTSIFGNEVEYQKTLKILEKKEQKHLEQKNRSSEDLIFDENIDINLEFS